MHEKLWSQCVKCSYEGEKSTLAKQLLMIHSAPPPSQPIFSPTQTRTFSMYLFIVSFHSCM